MLCKQPEVFYLGYQLLCVISGWSGSCRVRNIRKMWCDSADCLQTWRAYWKVNSDYIFRFLYILGCPSLFLFTERWTAARPGGRQVDDVAPVTTHVISIGFVTGYVAMSTSQSVYRRPQEDILSPCSLVLIIMEILMKWTEISWRTWKLHEHQKISGSLWWGRTSRLATDVAGKVQSSKRNLVSSATRVLNELFWDEKERGKENLLCLATYPSISTRSLMQSAHKYFHLLKSF